jgi:hypothetical protein
VTSGFRRDWTGLIIGSRLLELHPTERILTVGKGAHAHGLAVAKSEDSRQAHLAPG